MNVKVSAIDILTADIPFKTNFRHVLRNREASESIFVRLKTKDGALGFGEALPRLYVTGEDQKSVADKLKQVLPAFLLGKSFRSFEETVEFARSFSELTGSAKCAFELALLDLAGKIFNCSITEALGGIKAKRLRYSAAIGGDSVIKTKISALKFRLYGIKDIKLKVGDRDDLKRLKKARTFLGKNRDIRLDANCAWSAKEAIEKLTVMRDYRFSVIEQPTKKGDTESLKKVFDAISEPVMADESLCDIKDARKLVEHKACDMFNIRLSKCGGLLDSFEIAKFAKQSGISYQLGCQVGETGILSAAGRHFAACAGDVKYLEGSYAKFLLTEDVVAEDVSFGYGGFARPLQGAGFGVTVKEKVLNKYVTDKIKIS